MARKNPEVVLSIEEPDRPHVRIFGQLYQYKLPREGTAMERAQSSRLAQAFALRAHLEELTDEEAQGVYDDAKTLVRMLVYGVPEDVLARIEFADLAQIVFKWGEYFAPEAEVPNAE